MRPVKVAENSINKGQKFYSLPKGYKQIRRSGRFIWVIKMSNLFVSFRHREWNFCCLLISFNYHFRNHKFEAWSNEEESWWELRSESFAQEFCQLSWARRRRMRVDESWEARVWHKSSVNCHEPVKGGWELRSESFAREFCQLSCAGKTRMRDEKREFVREFCQLSSAGQTRMRVGESLLVIDEQVQSRWELLRVNESC
jgi:hypothetical protein